MSAPLSIEEQRTLYNAGVSPHPAATATVRPFTQVDNSYFDLMPHLSDAGWKVLCYIVRQTAGYHRDARRLSQLDIMRGTGKCRNTVKAALAELSKLGAIRLEEADDPALAIHVICILPLGTLSTNDRGTDAGALSANDTPPLSANDTPGALALSANDTGVSANDTLIKKDRKKQERERKLRKESAASPALPAAAPAGVTAELAPEAPAPSAPLPMVPQGTPPPPPLVQTGPGAQEHEIDAVIAELTAAEDWKGTPFKTRGCVLAIAKAGRELRWVLVQARKYALADGAHTPLGFTNWCTGPASETRYRQWEQDERQRRASAAAARAPTATTSWREDWLRDKALHDRVREQQQQQRQQDEARWAEHRQRRAAQAQQREAVSVG